MAGTPGGRSWGYSVTKRAFDLVVSFLLLPTFLTVALILIILNPWLNKGGLFYRQERMGQGCQPFRVWKFRSMTDGETVARGPFDALDRHRITPLGYFLRKTRLDELPQVINVFKGEMSLIGPRPDYLCHALIYIETVSGYRERHAAKPGITGYAQTQVGYVDGAEGVRDKVAADLHYLRRASLRLDLWITWRTIQVVFGRQGS